MTGDDGSAGGSYHFKTVDGPASTAVVEAVAFVTGRDPLDVELLGRILDPDALDSLVESADRATVSFGMEGLTVRVHAGGDILVEDPGGARPSTADLAGSNVLLLAPTETGGACTGRPRAVGSNARGTNVLAVSFSPPDEGRLDAWFADGDRGAPANAAVVGVGDFARSSTSAAAAVTSSPCGPTAPVAVDTVADPADLDSLEARIDERLAGWEGIGDRTIVCFDSVTALLGHVGLGRTVEFLQSVTERTRDAAASAHFHLDADSYDGEVAETVSPLFDTVATVDESGEWVLDPEPGR